MISIQKQLNAQLSVFLFLWITGFTDGSYVTQTSILWKNNSDNATMHCNQSKGSDYYQMYWFRQLPGKTMELIVLTMSTTKEHDFGKFSKVKFSAEKPDAFSGSFTVKTLEAGDTGLYFCGNTVSGSYPAYFGPGTKLTVLEHDVKEPKVEILGPSPKECRNEKDHEKKKTLLCVVSEFYPDHISVFWQVNENNVTSGVATDEIAQRDGKFYTMSSRLRVSCVESFFKTCVKPLSSTIIISLSHTVVSSCSSCVVLERV
uniref:Ig-like domain-containing protein n=1 Tax=Cynoglossus semilaevis TaxID=244447 RepID=A0A3P8VHY0_CYNSE